jgi:long-chain acyl-CoA synthetase
VTEAAETPPSTPDYVRFHAEHTPRAIAVIEDGRAIDYATFHRDLARFTRALGAFGLPRGSFVAVAWDSFYLHWLLLLACESLGWATASFLSVERNALAPLMARVQLILSTQRLSHASGAKLHMMTPDWLAGVFGSPAGEAAPTTPLGLDEPQRIRRSSGTSGGLKMMVATRRVEETRILGYLLIDGFSARSRLLLTMHFTVSSMYSRATACLRLGGTCIGEERSTVGRSIVRYAPSHVRLFQHQMRPVLDELPPDFRKAGDLTLMIGAAPLSAELRRELLDRIASRIIYTYNSNETGSVAVVGEDGVCTLRPGVQVEAVDGAGNPLPAGQLGRLRIRTRSMVDGYLDNAAASARSFRDGWFQSGDAGFLIAPGRLKLAGRSDDLLNIGGQKIEPQLIEEAVARAVAVTDVGVTSIANPDGVEEVCVAIVVQDAARAGEYRAEVEKSVSHRFGRTRVRTVDSLPRTAGTGKLRRGELKKLFGAG